MSDYSDIQAELDDFENAVYGEEVRDSMISAIKKIHDTAERAAGAPDATDATAGQAPIADGAGGWQWGDIEKSSGLNDYQRALLIGILRNGMYSVDMSDDITALEASFARTVTSLSATVNLGDNIIYSDDSLDTLRQYLSVTATYDDESRETVTGYSLAGTLTVGTSTIVISYRGAESRVQIPVSQAVVRYTVTNNLTGVTSSNTDASIAEGNTYTAILTANTAGYAPSDVSVTVGGTDVTSSVYDDATHTITIPNVQGNIVITASEAVAPPTADYSVSNVTFDGTASTVIDTGIKLCDTDKSFTIVVQIDTPTGTSVTSGANILSCTAGSTGTDGYYLNRTSAASISFGAYAQNAGVSFSDIYNTEEGHTQVYAMRHEAGSGSIKTQAFAIKNNVTSVGETTKTFTFASHDNPLILGARRWNGINGFINGTIKKIDVFLSYLTDEQIATYYD